METICVLRNMCSRGVLALENRGVLEEIKRYNLTGGKSRSKRKYN